MAAILLTHADAARRLYYGPKALAGLQALGTLWTNPGEAPFAPEEPASPGLPERVLHLSASATLGT